MKIIVLNGSPKGEVSVTLQYARYLEKVNPQHTFTYENIALQIKHLENDLTAFNRVIDQVRQSDIVLWAFPLYVLSVHGNYKRFIELITERGVQDAFAGKYTATLSTSIHFYDHTAHNYMHAVCDDLNMKYVDFFSADMNDLHKEEYRRQLTLFGQRLFSAVKNNITVQKLYPPLQKRDFTYKPGNPASALQTNGRKIVILHDSKDPESNLARMVNRVKERFGGNATVVNINELNIKGDCLGCLICGSSNRCFYEGKDDYIDFYRNTVMTADILVYAGSIVDRQLSARWKTFFDRIFFNSHTPVLQKKQAFLLVSGPIGQIPNLQEIMSAFFEFQGANYLGYISDESGTSADIDVLIDQKTGDALEALLTGYLKPETFLGIAGMKIFRDDIYGRLRTVFMADHKAYKRLGYYKTFPQNDFGVMMLNTFGAPLVNIPAIRAKFDERMKEEMVKPLQRVVEKTGV
ncbi:MAG: iron-sulfur protein [Chloroflexi bacterium]|jgi:multimeric flavodoxin WrbA|nr:iron-sulfur protein [Chloroflexota bacterium]